MECPPDEYKVVDDMWECGRLRAIRTTTCLHITHGFLSELNILSGSPEPLKGFRVYADGYEDKPCTQGWEDYWAAGRIDAQRPFEGIAQMYWPMSRDLVVYADHLGRLDLLPGLRDLKLVIGWVSTLLRLPKLTQELFNRGVEFEQKDLKALETLVKEARLPRGDYQPITVWDVLEE